VLVAYARLLIGCAPSRDDRAQQRQEATSEGRAGWGCGNPANRYGGFQATTGHGASCCPGSPLGTSVSMRNAGLVRTCDRKRSRTGKKHPLDRRKLALTAEAFSLRPPKQPPAAKSRLSQKAATPAVTSAHHEDAGGNASWRSRLDPSAPPRKRRGSPAITALYRRWRSRNADDGSSGTDPSSRQVRLHRKPDWRPRRSPGGSPPRSRQPTSELTMLLSVIRSKQVNVVQPDHPVAAVMVRPGGYA
jgi:hypothetical protein